jgi:hypothetical protein
MRDTNSVLFMLPDLSTLILFGVEYAHKLQMVLIPWFSNINNFNYLYNFRLMLQDIGLFKNIRFCMYVYSICNVRTFVCIKEVYVDIVQICT